MRDIPDAAEQEYYNKQDKQADDLRKKLWDAQDKIPKQYRTEKARFIKIDMTDPENREWKKPQETDWQNTRNYPYNDIKFQQYLATGDNYGIACGYDDIGILDADHIIIRNEALKKLPNTLRIKTGGYYFDDPANGRKTHFAFRVPGWPEGTINLGADPGGNHYGEFRWKGAMVIAPGSKHYKTGNTYEIENDVPITTITPEQLLAVITPYMDEHKLKKKVEKKVSNETKKCDVDITKVLNIADFDGQSKTEEDNGIFRGKHPYHESGTNRNFIFDIHKNLWYCNRHQTGGGTLEIIGIKHGIIKCENCYSTEEKPVFTKEQFIQVVKIAKENYEIEIPKREKITETVDPSTLTPNTLQQVHEVYRKHLYVPDTRRIDLLLAIAITKNEPGTPLWCIVVGSSGDGKSEFVTPLLKYENTRRLDNITPNALVSGKADTIKDKKTGEFIKLPAQDLGSKLQNASTLLVIPDLSVMSSKNSDDKSLIWAQMRNLFDGFMDKITGNGVNRAYDGCHVTMIGNSTSILRDEFIVHTQLGSREFLWDTGLEEIDTCTNKKQVVNKKTEMAWGNEQKEKAMRQELEDTVLLFLKTHKFKRIEDKDIPEEMKDFIIKEAHRLAILRATGIIDQQHRELINPVVPETPTRLVKQFKRLYIALKSLDGNYTDERAKGIIKTIVDGSGNVVRNMIMSSMKVSISWFDIAKLQDLTKIGRNSVKAQLEILWNMGIIDKEVQQRAIGGYNHTYTGSNGDEHSEVRGCQYRDVECYKWEGYDD